MVLIKCVRTYASIMQVYVNTIVVEHLNIIKFKQQKQKYDRGIVRDAYGVRNTEK